MATAPVEPTVMSPRKAPRSVNVKPETEPLSPKERALKLMREPFAPNQISKMCKSTKKDNQPGRCRDCGGFHKLPSVQLSYVGHAALTDRLLEADPEWTWEPLALTPMGTPQLDPDGGLWIKLTVGGVTRLGYGDAQGKTGGDATKERIGDALRNAAMRFGAALDLWHKGTLHAEETPEEEEKPVVASEPRPPQPVQPVQQHYPPRPPATPDRPSTPVGSILPFQKNAFLSAAKKSHKSSEQITDYLGRLGYESLDEMPKKDFPEALKWAME
jgi:hypothetical protein